MANDEKRRKFIEELRRTIKYNKSPDAVRDAAIFLCKFMGKNPHYSYAVNSPLRPASLNIMPDDIAFKSVTEWELLVREIQERD